MAENRDIEWPALVAVNFDEAELTLRLLEYMLDINPAGRAKLNRTPAELLDRLRTDPSAPPNIGTMIDNCLGLAKVSMGYFMGEIEKVAIVEATRAGRIQ